MKSLKDFKCGWIIPNLDIKKGENSHFFGEITTKASPPIYITQGVQNDFFLNDDLSKFLHKSS